MVVPHLPGYDVEAALSVNETTWRARRDADGRTVLLRWVALPTDSGAADAVRRTAARVAGLSAESLLPLQTVITTADALVLVHDYPAGGTLVGLLAERGRLSAGEVVTLGTSVAGALEAVHAAGLAHGSLTDRSIYFGLAGTPLLTDVGLVSTGDTNDLAALANVCRQALGGGRWRGVGPGASLAAVLDELARRAEGGAEGGAVEFAAALRGVAPAVAIRLSPPLAAEPAERSAGPGAPETATGLQAVTSTRSESVAPPITETAPSTPGARSTGRWRPHLGRRVVGGLSLLAALLGATALGVYWARVGAAPTAAALPTRSLGATPPPSSEQARTSSPAPSRSPTDSERASVSTAVPRPATPGPGKPAASASWREVMTSLDRRRGAALAAADRRGLAAADAVGSAALRADLRAVAELSRRGAHPEGLSWEVLDVAVASAGPPGVTLRVTDRMSAYRIVASDGALLTSRPARGPTVWRVQLLPTSGAWRVAQVAAG